MKATAYALLTSLLLSLSVFAHSDSVAAVTDLQQRWAQINYELRGKPQIEAFNALLTQAQNYRKQYPDSAEVLIWSGITKSSYAGARGGVKALGLAKDAKADLEQALEIDRHALQGSALTSLGTLYYKVPGWPVGFGDKGKAQVLLEESLSVNPDGIDPNYFYGGYLLEKRQYALAKRYFEKALAAPARPGRAVADAGRRQEVAAALAELKRHLK